MFLHYTYFSLIDYYLEYIKEENEEINNGTVSILVTINYIIDLKLE